MSAPGHTLRVLTLNLWNVDGPVRRRMRELATWLDEVHPDVVALQEVAVLDGAWQSDWLADRASYRSVLTADLPGSEGLAVLCDLPARAAPTVALPQVPRDSSRLLQQVDLDVDGRSVRLANTHWAWRLDDTAGRVRQARAVARVLDRTAPPVILCGDLNDVPGSPPLAELATAGLVETFAAAGADERPTFDRANPYTWQDELLGRRLDHVLVSADVAVRGARVVLDGEGGPVVSDHYGVLAELELPRGEARSGARSERA